MACPLPPGAVRVSLLPFLQGGTYAILTAAAGGEGAPAGDRLAAGGAFGRLLAHQIGLWKPVQHKLFTSIGGDLEADNAAYLHDPLTVQALVDPSALKLETLRIVTTIEGGTLRTHEVDPKLGIGMETSVATEVDAAAAERSIAERLATL